MNQPLPTIFVPSAESYRRPQVGVPPRCRRGSASQTVIASLSSLPIELLLMIYESLPDITSAQSLAKANKSLYEAWYSGRDQIVTRIFERTIPGWEQACTFAVFQRLRYISTDRLKGLRANWFVRFILRNAKICAKVCKWYRAICERRHWCMQDDGAISDHVPLSWSDEQAASLFYIIWLVASAFKERLRRQAIRQYLGGVPEGELDMMVDLATNLLFEFHDQDTREQLDLGAGSYGASLAGLVNPEAIHTIPQKWCFTVETIAVVKHKLENPSLKVGPSPKHFSNISGQGYQADWW